MGRNIVKNCNRLVELMTGEWLWFMGDDHVFKPDTLLRLLMHDADVVVPLVLQRQEPFLPVVCTGENEAGLQHTYALADIPERGLFEVHSAGTGGMLVRRRVFRAIEPPWFEPAPVVGGHLSEDFSFCKRIREAGFSIYCDPETQIGHLSIAAIWPRHIDGRWRASAEFPTSPS